MRLRPHGFLPKRGKIRLRRAGSGTATTSDQRARELMAHSLGRSLLETTCPKPGIIQWHTTLRRLPHCQSPHDETGPRADRAYRLGGSTAAATADCVIRSGRRTGPPQPVPGWRRALRASNSLRDRSIISGVPLRSGLNRTRALACMLSMTPSRSSADPRSPRFRAARNTSSTASSSRRRNEFSTSVRRRRGRLLRSAAKRHQVGRTANGKGKVPHRRLRQR